MKKIDFYFDFASPNAYFGFNVLKKFPEKYDCEINYIPVLLGEFLKPQIINLQWNNFLEF